MRSVRRTLLLTAMASGAPGLVWLYYAWVCCRVLPGRLARHASGTAGAAECDIVSQANQLTPFPHTLRLQAHGTTTEEPVMKTVKPRMTLLSATISALVLVGCQSEPRYEGQQVTVPRQQQVTVRYAAPLGVVTGARIGSAQERTLVAQDMVGQAWGPALVKMAPPQFTSTERYQGFADNGVVSTREQPLSTFSIDVDTGSYSNVRRFLESGQLPPVDAVRTEELVNYFAYDYPVDTAGEVPFSVYTEVAPSPWNAGRHLLHIGIQAVVPEVEEPPARNLVFLVDVSGSMHQPDKLPLLVSSLKLLTRQLDANDRISLVVYAGGAGVVLEPTPGDQQAAILRALDSLQAGGGTNGAAGIKEAYALAEAHFVEGGINRV